jgi:hypothetical protein
MSNHTRNRSKDAEDAGGKRIHTTDRVWREYNIHDDGDSDEEAAAASSFNLFTAADPGDTYETISYPDLLLPLHAASAIPIALRAHKQYENSTGMAVWKGSEVMSSYLIQHVASMVRNRRICELGAGVGLCGIVASRLGAKSVLMTDGDTTVLENLRHNVDLNSATAGCPQLIWGEESGRNFAKANGRQDVILAADCVYMAKSVRPLLETIHEVLEPKSGVFLYVNTCASQCPIEVVFDIAKEFGLNCADTWCNSDDEDDTVYIFRRQE